MEDFAKGVRFATIQFVHLVNKLCYICYLYEDTPLKDFKVDNFIMSIKVMALVRLLFNIK